MREAIAWILGTIAVIGGTAAVASACGSSAQSACDNNVSVGCQKTFQCDPEAGAAIFQTEALCEALLKTTCENPCGDGGAFNTANANTCATETQSATCTQINASTYDPTGACAALCH